MKKFFLTAISLFALVLVSCGDSKSLDAMMDVCDKAIEQVKAATSAEELQAAQTYMTTELNKVGAAAGEDAGFTQAQVDKIDAKQAEVSAAFEAKAKELGLM